MFGLRLKPAEGVYKSCFHMEFMSIYRWIGILRCPFLSKCGPDAGEGVDYEEEERDAEKTCFTRRHRGCECYKSLHQISVYYIEGGFL
jgi:hypothetical protein